MLFLSQEHFSPLKEFLVSTLQGILLLLSRSPLDRRVLYFPGDRPHETG